MSDALEKKSEIAAQAVGSVLSVVALFFALKASIFGIVYLELREIHSNVGFPGICSLEINKITLSDFSFPLIPIMAISDVGIFLISSAMFASTLKLARASRYFTKKSKRDDVVSFAMTMPLVAYFLLLIFAVGNFGATGYIAGSVNRLENSLPRLERIKESAIKVGCPS